MPTRIRFDALPRESVPRSLTASFSDGWSVELEDNGFIDQPESDTITILAPNEPIIVPDSQTKEMAYRLDLINRKDISRRNQYTLSTQLHKLESGNLKPQPGYHIPTIVTSDNAGKLTYHVAETPTRARNIVAIPRAIGGKLTDKIDILETDSAGNIEQDSLPQHLRNGKINIQFNSTIAKKGRQQAASKSQDQR